MIKGLIIETDRLILRPYQLEDADDIVEEDAIKYITDSIEKELYNFAIVLKSENKVIGATQISNISKVHSTAGGGIWINYNN